MAKGYVFDPDKVVDPIKFEDHVKVRTDEMHHIRPGFYTIVRNYDNTKECKVYSKRYEFKNFENPKPKKKGLMDILKTKKKS